MSVALITHEHIFRNDSAVLYSPTFQHRFYPGSGVDTRSDHIVNVLLPAGTKGPEFRSAFALARSVEAHLQAMI